MATLGKWSGSAVSVFPTTSYAAPNALFPTEDRNDGSAYSWASSTSTLTLPSSGLADGYLIVAAVEIEVSHNNRATANGKFAQTGGTGTFVTGVAGGYARDDSEDRAYLRTFAFIDNPSAGATIQFQWKRDAGTGTPAGACPRSELQVIPLYYSDFGAYTSSDSSLLGGTTPTLLPGFSGTDGTNITISSNVVSVTGDNKRYLILGSYYSEGRGGRTQRWGGLEIDGTFDDAAKGYTYYRDTTNDMSGEIFTHIIETVTATRTIEMNLYRGNGVANLDGGADSDGSTPGVGEHALIVLELNDSAEIFLTQSNANSSALNGTPPIDLAIAPTGTFVNDSASFTRISDTAINAEVAMDALLGANISAASNSVGDAQRWTAFAEFTINGTEDTDSFAGDYLRNNQSSQDTFGWSANLLGFLGLAQDEDIGISVSELSGTENGGNAVSPSGWSGMWGINLDTLEAAAVADGAMSGVGTGVATPLGASQASAAASADGVALASPEGQATAGGDITSNNEAGALIILTEARMVAVGSEGAALTSGVLDSAGAGAATFDSQSSTAVDLSSVGVAAATATTASLIDGNLAAAGVALATLVGSGEALVESDLTSIGIATATLEGTGASAAQMSSTGISTATALDAASLADVDLSSAGVATATITTASGTEADLSSAGLGLLVAEAAVLTDAELISDGLSSFAAEGTSAALADAALDAAGAALATLTSESAAGAPLLSDGIATGTLEAEAAISAILTGAGAAVFTAEGLAGLLGDGALASDGTSSATLSTESLVQADLAGDGVASATPLGASTSSVVLSVTATSAFTAEGLAGLLGDAALDSAGTSSATLVPQALIEAALSALGAATATLEGATAAAAEGALDAAGTALASLSAQAQVEAALAADGAGTALLEGVGVGGAPAPTPEPEPTVPGDGGAIGRNAWREQRQREERERELEEAELIALAHVAVQQLARDHMARQARR